MEMKKRILHSEIPILHVLEVSNASEQHLTGHLLFYGGETVPHIRTTMIIHRSKCDE